MCVMEVIGVMMEGPKGKGFAGYRKGQTGRFTLENTCETFQTSHLSTFFLGLIAGIAQHLANKSNNAFSNVSTDRDFVRMPLWEHHNGR